VVTVLNRIGVMARITSLLSARGYNIESVIAAPTENPDIFRIHLVLSGTEKRIEQVVKQLNKLIDTIKVTDISHTGHFIIREFVLVKVNGNRGNRSDIFSLVDVFNAKLVDVGTDQIVIDLSGPRKKVDRFIELLKPFGIREMVRSGCVAISEG
jgi:acetolactate synthase-1/3 small subunit